MLEMYMTEDSAWSGSGPSSSAEKEEEERRTICIGNAISLGPAGGGGKQKQAILEFS